MDAKRRLVVLIVEDHPGVLDSLERLVERWPNVDILSADGSLAALKWIGLAPCIDLLLSDVCLPGEMTGVDIAAFAVITHPGIAVVLLSADAKSEIKGLVERYAFVRKPFGGDQLTAHIDKAFLGLRPMSELVFNAARA